MLPLRHLLQRRLSTLSKLTMTSIKLNDTERQLSDLLVKFGHDWDARNATKDPLTLRFTGGWVRDKLLGQNSNDIDIAINSLTGAEFVDQLHAWISANPGSYPDELRSKHTIKLNPDKSKHLETATTNLFGLDVDFVNLRSEEYSDESRVPVVQFGTAEQDAYRRDATLNALFYNLQEKKVEDLTGKGLADLEEGILRTPLAPKQTFKDDPLRVLRLIRFAARFNFQLAPEAIEAIVSGEDIKHALETKISRERVGIELDKMFTGPCPEYGLRLIAKLGLEHEIFGLPEKYATKETSKPLFHLAKAVDTWEAIRSSENLHINLLMAYSGETKKMIWALCALYPWDKITAVTEKNKPCLALFMIIREGIKWSTHDGDVVTAAINNVDAIEEAVNAVNSGSSPSRADLAQLVRKCGEHWSANVLFAAQKSIVSGADMESTLKQHSALVDAIVDQKVDDAWSIKPLVNGKEIMATLQAKPGKWLATLLNDVVVWQFTNPEGTKKQCLDYVVERKKELE